MRVDRLLESALDILYIPSQGELWRIVQPIAQISMVCER